MQFREEMGVRRRRFDNPRRVLGAAAAQGTGLRKFIDKTLKDVINVATRLQLQLGDMHKNGTTDLAGSLSLNHVVVERC